jgi:hypothetical protein
MMTKSPPPPAIPPQRDEAPGPDEFSALADLLKRRVKAATETAYGNLEAIMHPAIKANDPKIKAALALISSITGSKPTIN